MMSPLPEGGVCVFLYQHGIALIAPGNDPNIVQPVLQCQIPPMAHKKDAGSSVTSFPTAFTNQFIESVRSSLQNVFDEPNDGPSVFEPTTLFKTGQKQLHLLDFRAKKLVSVSTPSISIQSISPLRTTDSNSSTHGICHWIVTGIRDKDSEMAQTIVSYSPHSETATLGEFTFDKGSIQHFSTPYEISPGWDSHKARQWSVEDGAIWNHASSALHPPGSRIVEWAGSARSHFGVLSINPTTTGDAFPIGALSLWPRSESFNKRQGRGTINQSVIAGNNFAPSYVVNGLQGGEHGNEIDFDICD
jgi:hypothetical protein